MNRVVWLSLVLIFAGCASSVPQQVHQLNTDGVALLRKREYAAAQQRFQEALALDPGNATTLYNLAAASHQAGDLVFAEKCYRDHLIRDPDHGPTRHGLTLLMLQTNRSEEAWKFIEDWLENRPHLAGPHAEYGWLLRERGDLPAAQARLQKALEIDPGNVRALIELGIVYETYSYPDRARSLYERALLREPDQPEVMARLTSLERQPSRKPPPAPSASP